MATFISATYTQLEKLLHTLQPTHILHGGAKGVDTLADRYATENQLPKTIIKPDYKNRGKHAPLIRNTELVQLADKVICIYATSARSPDLIALAGDSKIRA